MSHKIKQVFKLLEKATSFLKSNKFVLILISFIFLSNVLNGQNLIKNGSFIKINDSKKIVDWEITSPSAKDLKVGIDSTNSTTGGKSIRIQHNEAAFTRLEQLHVKVKPNTKYLIKFSAKVENIKEAPGSRGASLFIGRDGVLMKQFVRISAKSHPVTSGWHTYSREFNSRNNRELGICLYLHKSSGTVWFDDVQLLEITSDLQQSIANNQARKLVEPDVKAVRKLANSTNDKEVLEKLKMIEKKFIKHSFGPSSDRRNGLPFYPFQQKLYDLYGKMLAKKYPNQPLIISTASPFSRCPHLQAELPPLTGPIQINGIRDDIEQFVLNFTNCSTKTQKIQFTIPKGLNVLARKVVEVQSSIGLIDDPLCLMTPSNDNYCLEVPAGLTKQLWFEVKLPALPGKKKFTMDFLLSSGKTISCNIDVTVFNLKLPEKLPLKTFGYAFAYTRKLTCKRISDTAKDLKKHHNNTWMNRRGQAWPRPVVENGKLVPEKIQWELLDRNMKYFPFRNTFIYFIHWNYLKYGPEVFKAWVREVVKRFKERGLGYDSLLLTWTDEPFSNSVKKIAETTKLIREADPNLRVYSNFHDVLSEEDIKLLAKAVDVIAPEYNQLTDRKLKIIKNSGKELWCYRVQERNVLPQDVRMAFWKLHKLGVKGYSAWCYRENKNGWNMPNGSSCYNMIYAGDSRELTPSKRWEAWREGIEDYTLLQKLKEKSHHAYASIIAKYKQGNLNELRQLVLRKLSEINNP